MPTVDVCLLVRYTMLKGQCKLCGNEIAWKLQICENCKNGYYFSWNNYQAQAINQWPWINMRYKTNTTAQIIWEPTAGVYRASVDINWRDDGQKGFPIFMKATLPVADRSYDPTSKSWFFSESHFIRVKDYVKLFWTNVFTYTKDQSDEFQRQAQQQDQSYYQATVHSLDKYIQQFLDILFKHGIIKYEDIATWKDVDNYELSQKYYKKAVRILHPDINPSGATDMSLLNEAWSMIKAEREAKQNA